MVAAKSSRVNRQYKKKYRMGIIYESSDNLTGIVQ